MNYLPYIAAAITLGLGIAAICFPSFMAERVGIGAPDSFGRSEVRATYGGLFVGLGAVCLWLQSQEAFLVAGIAWAAAAAARVLSMLVERDVSGKNWLGILVEGGIGGLILGFRTLTSRCSSFRAELFRGSLARIIHDLGVARRLQVP